MNERVRKGTLCYNKCKTGRWCICIGTPNLKHFQGQTGTGLGEGGGGCVGGREGEGLIVNENRLKK